MRPPPGEGRGSCRGREGNSPSGEDGESELKELLVDMDVDWLFLKSPLLLPSSNRPEPGLDLSSDSPGLHFEPFEDHMTPVIW